nr:recombinase family protein [Rhizobium sp. IBUN]
MPCRSPRGSEPSCIRPHDVTRSLAKPAWTGKRKELRRCLYYAREGDTVLVTKLDRLAQ